MALIWVTLLLFLIYSTVIFFYNRSWRAFPETHIKEVKGSLTISVIIPARNEAAHIERLLQSLQAQTYPKELFEVIVVDDHSTDSTTDIVGEFASRPADFPGAGKNEKASVLPTPIALQLISLRDDTPNSYKKKAIETGIAAAKNEWVVCTDADGTVPANWLASFALLIKERNPVFIAAPVSINLPKGEMLSIKHKALYLFQALDFMTLQGITAASVYKNVHSMSNGANLAYKRAVFYEVEGFKNIDDIASGDDMLLMHKIWKKYPDRVLYLKSREAIVKTDAAHTWNAFFNQRIRWASKGKSYDDKRIFTVLLVVYLFNFSFFVLFFAAFWDVKYFVWLIGFWIAKTAVEYPFVSAVSSFFGMRHLMRYFFLFQPLHILYTIVAGFLGSFGSYEWKGRRVK